MWYPLKSNTVRELGCSTCNIPSGWHPRGWWFKYVPVSGRGKKGRKISVERLCPACAEASGVKDDGVTGSDRDLRGA